MDFFDRLEEARKRWNVLEHPFYTRWEKGELTQEELGYYAGQYRHAVVALAATARQAADADPTVREHADDEEAHMQLWDDFGSATGATDGTPRDETRDVFGPGRAGATGSRPSRSSMRSSRASRRSRARSSPAWSSTTATRRTARQRPISAYTRSSITSTRTRRGA